MEYIKIKCGDSLQTADMNQNGMTDDVFQHSFNPLFTFSERIWKPHMDIFETPSEIIIQAEIAGVKKNNIMIEVFENAVKISGKRVEPTPAPNCTYRLVEIQNGSFERVLRLPNKIDPQTVSASCDDGMLQVNMSKISTSKE